MSFTVQNKVALVTGATGGIGFAFVKELLKHGAKGVSLVDINEDSVKKLLQELENEFGPNKAIFIKTDVGDKDQFDDAFKKTIEKFKNVDILVNAAGIFRERNPEQVVRVNLLGTINGTYLAVEKYLEKYRSGSTSVVLNVASVAGLEPFAGCPIYSATKFGVHGLTLAWGAHFERTKIKVVAVCPGGTHTDMLGQAAKPDFVISEAYNELNKLFLKDCPVQSAQFCAEKIIKVIEKGDSATVWAIDKDEPYQFVLPDRSTMEKKYL